MKRIKPRNWKFSLAEAQREGTLALPCSDQVKDLGRYLKSNAFLGNEWHHQLVFFNDYSGYCVVGGPEGGKRGSGWHCYNLGSNANGPLGVLEVQPTERKILFNWVSGASREKVHTVHEARVMWLIDRDFWSARFWVHRDALVGQGDCFQAGPCGSMGTNP